MANALKKMLGMRERRRIYEDAVCIVKQANKMSEAAPESTKKTIQKVVKKQLAKTMGIVITTLGYHEENICDENEVKHTILLPEDNDAEYGIPKDKMEDILIQLPDNKELKESLWKSCVKRDKKATELFRSLIS